MAGYDIAQLKGTPLYDLARNANVYGGKTLSKTEMVFFQQQCREMGFDPAKYGLEIETEDLEGADFKETQRAQRNLTNSIDQAYQGQFGKKNNAVQVAKDAETRAYSIINTAKEAFVRNHGDVNFTPENLGQRPNFMAPEYKDNLTKYVTDLTAWGNKVAEQYRNADNMTNEQLAAQIMNNDNANTQMIMSNDDANTAFQAALTLEVGAELAEKMDANTQAIINEVKAGNAEVIKAIKTAEGNIIHVVRTEGGHTRAVITNAKNQIIGVTREEGFITRLQEFNNTVGLHEHMDAATDDINANTSDEARHTRRTVDDRADELQDGIDQNNRDDRRRNFNPLNPLTWY